MSDYEQENAPPKATHDRTVAAIAPERWQQIKEVFGAAAELAPSERNSFLQETCGADDALRAEVESLLIEEQSSVASTGIVGRVCDAPEAPAQDHMIGRRLGAYEVVRKIGYGGMAAVYLAARADDQYRKQVAIKLVMPGLDNQEIVRRFRTERQTLAALDHPNIVKLLDGGTAEEGLPYLVMDYVEGIPIDEYCDRHNQSTTERLQLFRAVCAAVQHAHENQVIHRDLKPSNILVTADGMPKLLDFGIARVLNPDIARTLQSTQSGMRALTPAYASPEQVRGEPVTPASDVYALGVVLYELLTGHHPYQLKRRTPLEIEQAICETDPEKPSIVVSRVETETLPDGTTKATITPELVSRTREGDPEKLCRRLRGDLDNIVLTALDKEPQRRYASVEEFSTDIERHLKHRPVRARKSTLAYRSSKFIRRHKVEVVAGALVMLVVIGGMLLVRREARHAAERARSEWHAQLNARRSVAVLGFKNLSRRADVAWLSTALSQMLTTELGAGEKLRTIPGENVAQMRISLSLPDAETLSPKTLARVHRNLGNDYVVLGSYLALSSEPGAPVRLDLSLQDAVGGQTISEIAETGTVSDLFGLVSRTGMHLREKLGLGEVSATEAAAVGASLPSNVLAARLYSEGLAKLRVFDSLGARDLLERATAEEPNHALTHAALADVWQALGYDGKASQEAKKALDLSGNLSREQRLMVEGRYRQATKEWDLAIGIYQTLFAFFPDNLDYGLRLSAAQTSAGKGQDALAMITVLRKLPAPQGEDPRIDLAEADATGSVSDFKSQAAAASQAVEKGETSGARLLVAQARVAQGRALRNLGDAQEAKAASYEARKLFVAVGDRYGEARSLSNIAAALFDQGHLQEARKIFTESLQIRREIGDRAGEAAQLNGLAVVLAHQKDIIGARQAYERSLALSREMGDRRNEGTVLNNIGTLETQQGRLSEAKSNFKEALSIDRKIGNQSEIARVSSNIAAILADEGDLVGARGMFEETLEISRHIGEKNQVGIALNNLAFVQLALGELGAAQKLYYEALQVSTEIGDQNNVGYVFSGLAEIMAIQGNLDGARKQQEQALAIREKIGEKGPSSESQLALATLSLEAGRPSEGEPVARRAVEEFRAQNDRDNEAKANAVLAQCLLAEMKKSEAQLAIARARKLVVKSRNRDARISVALADARIRSALGNVAEAASIIQEAMQAAQKTGFIGLQFETRLAMGEVEMKLGKLAAGQARLEALEKDASGKSFALIARKATAAIAGNLKQS